MGKCTPKQTYFVIMKHKRARLLESYCPANVKASFMLLLSSREQIFLWNTIWEKRRTLMEISSEEEEEDNACFIIIIHIVFSMPNKNANDGVECHFQFPTVFFFTTSSEIMRKYINMGKSQYAFSLWHYKCQ